MIGVLRRTVVGETNSLFSGLQSPRSCSSIEVRVLIALGTSNDYRVDNYDVNDNDDLLINMNTLVNCSSLPYFIL